MNNQIQSIVITYNYSATALNELIRNLANHEIVVIDNARALHKDDLGKATLLSQRTNTGYAGGANVGMRHALAHGAKWLVILNQDISMTRKAAATFSEYLFKAEPGIYGPIAGGLDAKRWTTILPSMKTDYISGACIAIHRDVIAKIGYFFEPYFLYYEEADYCIRARRAGFPVKLALIEGITHEESVTLGRGSFAHQYYMARNHLLFVSRLAPDAVKRYEYMRLPWTISEHIMRSEKGGLSGVRDFLLRRFGPGKGAS